MHLFLLISIKIIGNPRTPRCLMRNLYKAMKTEYGKQTALGQQKIKTRLAILPLFIQLYADYILGEAAWEEDENCFKTEEEKSITCVMLITFF